MELATFLAGLFGEQRNSHQDWRFWSLHRFLSATLVSEQLSVTGTLSNANVRVETGSIPAVLGETAVGVVGGLLANLGFAVDLILVDNAGINTVEHRVTFDEFPASEWDWIIETDLNGVVICSRVVSPIMVAQKAGRMPKKSPTERCSWRRPRVLTSPAPC